MSQLALVANHRNAWPSRDEIAALGVTGLRSIVYSNDEFEQALKGVPSHVRVVAMLNNEHEDVGGDWSDWDRAVREFGQRFKGRVEAVECGNELDLWGLSPEFGADLAQRADDALMRTPILTILSSVAGPNWQEWIEDAAQRAGLSIDGVALHPYGQRPDGWKNDSWGFGNLRDAINQAHSLSGQPVYLTEWGVKLSDAGGPIGQSDYLVKGFRTISTFGESIVPFAAFFAWHDKVGRLDERGHDGFGLRAENGNSRTAWFTYSRLNETIQETPKTVPTPPKKTVYTLDEVRQIRWQAIVPDAEYHADWGFEAYWRDHPELGSPLTAQELTLDTGEQCRPFANGIAIYRDGKVEVEG